MKNSSRKAPLDIIRNPQVAAMTLAMTLAGCETHEKAEQAIIPPIKSATQEATESAFNAFTKGDVQPGMNEIMGQAEGRKWTGRLKSNGGRGAAIYVPTPLDPKEATELILFFHGSGANEISASDNAEKTGRNKLEIILDAVHQMDNVALVYPLSAGARGVKGVPYDERWMRTSEGESMAEMIREVEDILKNEMKLTRESFKITLKAHSAGGQALKNGAASLARAKIPVSRVGFLDASYSDWAWQTYNHLAPSNPNIKFNILMAVNKDSEEAMRNGKGVNSRATQELAGKRGVNSRQFESEHSELLCTHFNWQKTQPCDDLFERDDDKKEKFFRLREDSMFKKW